VQRSFFQKKSGVPVNYNKRE